VGILTCIDYLDSAQRIEKIQSRVSRPCRGEGGSFVRVIFTWAQGFKPGTYPRLVLAQLRHDREDDLCPGEHGTIHHLPIY
jgi:hypothetical protein